MSVPAGRLACPPMPWAVRRASARWRSSSASRRRTRGRVRAHQGGRERGDGVGGGAAVELRDHGALRVASHGAARERARVVALLAAAHGELGIRREQERRLVVVLKVPVDVAHAGLLVGAKQHAQRVARPGARGLGALGDEVRHVQRQHGRALVVDGAAAKKPALAARHLKGVGVPTGPLGHHVDVRDHGELRVGVARDVGIAQVAVAVMRGKSQPAGDGERLVERLARARPPRRALTGGREVLDAPDGDERPDVLEHLGPDSLHVFVNLALEPRALMRSHGTSPFGCRGPARPRAFP